MRTSLGIFGENQCLFGPQSTCVFFFLHSFLAMHAELVEVSVLYFKLSLFLCVTFPFIHYK